MKKFLYLSVMLLNALGSLLSLSLFFLAGSFSFQNIFIVIGVSVIFIISFTATILDYNRINKEKHVCRIYSFPVKNHCNVRKNEVVITDYRDYFASKKFDFTIA